MNKIYIAIPAFRYVEPDAKEAINRQILSTKNWEVGAYKEMLHQSMISRARNVFAKLFLDTTCTHLLFVDADIVILTPGAIDKLLEVGEDVVAGAYVFKDYPHNIALRFLNKKDREKFDKQELDPCFKVKYASTGFMLIKREVFKVMNYPFPFRPYAVDGEYLSEDWSFCDRVGKWTDIWVRQDIELGHLGLYPFTVNDYFKMKEKGVIK